ncbi:peptidoglycan-binding domain-containing protein [Streptomyces sp. NPDC046862]|uniref:peptidoglycan-binding domain-containing protein n=1 Tax=Streptomyces sp. NPDC046862 TaxID=3154603 RepID=UPI00345370A7
MSLRGFTSAAAIAVTLATAVLVTPASADDWNSGMGPRAVSVQDLDRPECENLAIGASGWCTTALQTTLNQVGYRVATDGKFGPGTRAQLQLFQQEHDTKADGIVGPATRFRLRGAVANAEAAQRIQNHEPGLLATLACEFTPTGFDFGLRALGGFSCEDMVDGTPAA